MEPMSQDEENGASIITLSNVQSSTYIVHHVSQEQIEQLGELQIHPDNQQDHSESGIIEMDEFLQLKQSNTPKSGRGRLRKPSSLNSSKMKSSPKDSPREVKPKNFSDSWLLSSFFKDWLERHPSSNTKAICKVCNKVLLAGKSELMKHGMSKKHKRFLSASMPWDNDKSIDDSDLHDNSDQPKENVDGLNCFEDDWLHDPLFKDWLVPHSDSPYKAMCKACNKILLANRTELVKHKIQKKHRDCMASSGLSNMQLKSEIPEDAMMDQEEEYSIEETEITQDEEDLQTSQVVYEDYTEIPHRSYKVVPTNTFSSLSSSNKKEDELPQAFVTQPAPNWKGKAVVNGHVQEMKLSDYRGRYLVMFFYPQDFSTVCSTEVIALGEVISAFRVINCEVIACSVDSHLAHLAWTKTLSSRNEARIIPLLSDSSHSISKAYGCYLASAGHALRAYYIIDKKGILRAMHINDIQVGRNLKEILRMVEAFQLVDSTDTQCPVNWTTGQPSVKVIL